MTDRKPADRIQRDRALDPERSFIVQAPAGSGKTDLLVKRYLVLLGRVQKPEEIVAITFTRKAAAEMKMRVLEALPDAAELAPRLRIQTIDALCASLTRQMPVLAKFGAQPESIEDAFELYRDAASRTLETLTPAVERLLAHLDNHVEAAVQLLAGMLAKRDQWMRNTGVPPTREELESALVSERDRLESHAKALLPEANEELARELLTKEGAWRKKNKQARTLSAHEDLRLALAALLALPPAKYSEAQWRTLEAILALLAPAVAQLKVVFGERHQCDFTEIAQGALRALGEPEDPTDLMLSLDYRIHHLLVDEFQDTSVSQWELLERLTAGWQEGDGRTVFVVGDPMQSIYRFREAQVSLFLHARRAGLANAKLEPITLSTNFRSQAGIVEWVNRMFPDVLPRVPDESSGAVPYSASSASHPALPGGAVSWQLFSDRASEASQVVRLLRNAKGKTAILVRNRNHLDEIVPALKEAGIRFRAVEIEHLGDKQVVQDLYALTRALVHPADRAAWLAILRAPWCGLDLEELSSFFEGQTDRSVWELIQDVPSLERIRGVLAPALENRQRGSLRVVVEGVWLALGGPACVDDTTDLEDADIYLDELERLEEAGDLADPAALEEALEKLYALPDAGAPGDAVEIMTIHKAKGLEFGTVIVPGLDRTLRHGEPPLLIHKELPDGKLLLAPIRETGETRDAAYDYVRALERESEDLEAGRLFYVAATRAIERLYLLGCVAADDAGEAKPPDKRSLLRKLWFAAGEAAIVPAEPPAPRTPSAAAPADLLRRLPRGFVLPPPPEPARRTPPPEGREEARIEFSWAGETARHVGTVVHRWLQRIAEDALEGWDARRVERLRSRFAIVLRQRGVPPAEIDNAADLVVTAVRNSITDERGRWLLGPHPEARSEYRIRTAAGSFVIDRVLTDENGERWVVDYKTSRHLGANVEAFLDEEGRRYAPQLERYARALGDVRLGLYFPLLKGWRAVESG